MATYPTGDNTFIPAKAGESIAYRRTPHGLEEVRLDAEGKELEAELIIHGECKETPRNRYVTITPKENQ